MEWQPIATAPKDGAEVIVGVDIATVWITRGAAWSDGEYWEMQGFAVQDEAIGWWSYCNSVSQERLEGIYAPTHWLLMPDPPG